jgi:intracellular multiplication protein IcmK
MRETKGQLMAKTKTVAAWAAGLALASAASAAFAQAAAPAGAPALAAPTAAQAAPAQTPAAALAAQGTISPSQIPAGPAPAAAAAAQPPLSLPPLPAATPKADANRVMDDVFGLTPDEIRKLRRESDERQRAASESPSTPPKPVTTSVVASLAPGATPPVVRLAPNFATSVIITDSTGAPWPIENFVAGSDGAVDVRRPVEKDPEGSALSIVPKGYYSQTNLVVYLKGLATPVAITFITGQKQVDYRVDLRVLGTGPNARASVAQGLPGGTDTQLLSLLEGVAPADAKPLQASDPAMQAWMGRNGHMLVRTSMQVISPAWIGSVRSADGTTAYEMPLVSTLLTLRGGAIVPVNVKGW